MMLTEEGYRFFTIVYVVFIVIPFIAFGIGFYFGDKDARVDVCGQLNGFYVNGVCIDRDQEGIHERTR